MMAFAGSVYLVSTAAFCLFCLWIGARLLLLGQRSGSAPERLLGLGLGLTGGVGYGVLIAVSLTRQARGEAPDALLTWGSGLGKGIHDLGVVAFLAFVVRVFRPGVTWARGLAAAMAAVMAVGFVGYGLDGGFVHGRPEGFWYWLEFATIGTYPVWSGTEALLYYGQMKKRRALGLADALVTDRFRIWAVASLFTFLAIWTVSLPAILGLPYETQIRVAPLAMLVTAVWGSGAIASYWLTFFPPAWYRTRLAAPETRG
jgi:hypothetical protein